MDTQKQLYTTMIALLELRLDLSTIEDGLTTKEAHERLKAAWVHLSDAVRELKEAARAEEVE